MAASASAVKASCRNKLGAPRAKSAVWPSQTSHGAATSRTLNAKAPRPAPTNRTPSARLTDNATAAVRRLAACLAPAHAAAAGALKSSSVEPMNRAGELNPPHHM